MKKNTRIFSACLLTFILSFSSFINIFEKASSAKTLSPKLNQITNEKDAIKKLLKNSFGELLKPQVVNNTSVNDLSSIKLNFNPIDTVKDPNRPIIYMTDGDTNKLHAVNYETGEIKNIQLSLQPERVTIANNEVYVTLLKVTHDSYNFDNHIGAIAIINAESFTLTEQFDINEDPYDIQVDNQGYIYIAPGSGQWESLVVYSRQTKQEVSRKWGIYEQSFIHLHPTLSKVYAVDTCSSPRDIETYIYSNGICQNTYDSPYHGDYDLNTNMRISPDGKYIFNGSGMIFKCSNAKEYDMTYLNQLSSPFTDIAFDINSNLIYAAQQGGSIKVYNYENFSPISTLSTEGVAQDIYYSNNKLLSVSKTPNNTFILERKNVVTAPQEPPKVVETYPNNNSKNMPIQGVLGVKFNKNILVKNSYFSLTNSNNQQVSLKNYGVDDDVFYVSYANLNYNTKYTLTIGSGAISDYSGNMYNNSIVLNFTTGAEYNRLCGMDRYKTCIKISQNTWSRSDYVVLATGEDFPDALCAAPLAAHYDAPILLTTPKTLNPSIELEITRLQPKRIFIVGGSGAVSTEIEQKLKSKGIVITRFCGATRYDTSLEIAKHLGNSEGVFVVTGENYPDALSIASCAAYYEVPILLTETKALPAKTQAYIKNSGVTSSYIIGGSGVVSDAVFNALPNCKRIAGKNRYETNCNVLSYFSYDFTNSFIATGENFADALSGSSPAGLMHGPIILVDNNMPQDIIDELRYNKDIMKMKIILGGTGAVSDSIINRIFK